MLLGFFFSLSNKGPNNLSLHREPEYNQPAISHHGHTISIYLYVHTICIEFGIELNHNGVAESMGHTGTTRAFFNSGLFLIYLLIDSIVLSRGLSHGVCRYYGHIGSFFFFFFCFLSLLCTIAPVMCRRRIFLISSYGVVSRVA